MSRHLIAAFLAATLGCIAFSDTSRGGESGELRLSQRWLGRSASHTRDDGTADPVPANLPPSRHPTAVPTPALSPQLQLFCSDPVKAICGGEQGKALREARLQAFGRSPLGKLDRDEVLEKLRASLFPGGHEPGLKTDAWWENYEKFVRARFRMVGRATSASSAELEHIHSVLEEVVTEPGFAKVFKKSVSRWDPDAKPVSDRMVHTQILATEADFVALKKTLLAEKKPATFRKVLETYKEVCEKPGAEDNAVNLNQRWVILCPEKLARMLYRHEQEKGLGPPIVGLIHTLGHELGHSMEFTSAREVYQRMFACLVRRHPRPGSDGAQLVNFEFEHFMDEISADYWGAVTLAHELPKYPGHAMDVLSAELDTYCDSPGTKFEFERTDPGAGIITDVATERASDLGFREKQPTHPKGTYRVEFMGSQPLLRAALGCPAPVASDPVGCGLQGETPGAKW